MSEQGSVADWLRIADAIRDRGGYDLLCDVCGARGQIADISELRSARYATEGWAYAYYPNPTDPGIHRKYLCPKCAEEWRATHKGADA